MIGRYATPQAFRVALEVRLRDIALSRGADLQRLQRRVAFERLAALAHEIGLPVPTLQEAYAWLDTQWCSWGLDNRGGQ